MEVEGISKKPALPVTVLSGFLGSGKTTLLKHILTNKGSLRCAVIVNDMAELNIDATLVKNAEVMQREEKLVQMENGCICCTLREDLLQELRELAKQDMFDYIIIESTGISEPQQVAETFFFKWDDNPVLNDVARLDTCVTMVDVAQLLPNIHSIKAISEQSAEPVAPEDERNVSTLMMDQLEFADVIILNKVDLIPAKKLKSLMALIHRLNPRADVLSTKFGRIPLERILNTKKFDLDSAILNPGWLQAMREPAKPESEEYGISSFVYRARRPFHPRRLYNLVMEHFLVQEIQDEADDDADNDGNVEMSEADDGGEEGDDIADDDNDGDDDDVEIDDDEAQGREMSERLEKRFGRVIRSKGFVWLAGDNNDLFHWEWSQAGLVLSLNIGSPWFCAVPKQHWDQGAAEPSEELVSMIVKDFVADVGDRRQEIVFIGQDVDQKELSEALDKCLLTDEEWTAYWPRIDPHHSADAPDGNGNNWTAAPFSLMAPSHDQLMALVTGSDEHAGHDHGHVHPNPVRI